MLLGLVMPSGGEVKVFGADMSRNRYEVAYRINFQSPYIDLQMRLTVKENLTGPRRTSSALYSESPQRALPSAAIRSTRLLKRCGVPIACGVGRGK
jgi:ABC-type multidrug transport system ATPase subunit